MKISEKFKDMARLSKRLHLYVQERQSVGHDSDMNSQ
jgi:hypothetical protein